MNYFELDYDDVIINEFKIFPNFTFPQSFTVEKFLELRKVTLFIEDISISDTECWEFQCDKNLLIFGYSFKISESQNFILKLFHKNYNDNSENWIFDDDIALSQLVSVHGILIKAVLFCNKIQNSEIVIISLLSAHCNHLVRYDLKLKSITDFHSFPLSSIFVPCLSESSNSLDTVIDPDKNITVVLINQDSGDQSIECPTIDELKSVLKEKLMIAVQELFRFWLGNISDITAAISQQIGNDSPNILHHGVALQKYVNFLYIHHSVLLEIIFNDCVSENSTSILSNRFVEQLSNLTNEYVNEAINVLVQLAATMQMNLSQLKNRYEDIGRLVKLLCDNGHRYRKLVLSSRWSFGTFLVPSASTPNKPTLVKTQSNAVDRENWKTMGKNAIIKQSLLNRSIGALKSYFLKNSRDPLTEMDIVLQTRLIILSQFDKCSWNELTELIKKLGYEPIQTLISLCLETTKKRIRNDIYFNLDLESQNPNYKLGKDLIDKVEDALIVANNINNSFSTNNSDLYSNIQPFIVRYEKSKCESLKTTFIGSPSKDPTQIVNLKLNWLMEFYNRPNLENDGQELETMVDLFLVDADYKSLLLPFFDNAEIFRTNLALWMAKWKDRDGLLVKYLKVCNDSDLVISVIESDMTMDGSVTDAILDELITIIISGNDSHQFTPVDRWSSTNIMMYLLIHQPALFITKLTQRYESTLSQVSEIIGNGSSITPLHYMCNSRNCSFNAFEIKDSVLLSFMNKKAINDTVSHMTVGEFPILLYFLLEDNRDSTYDFVSNRDHTIQRTIQFNSGIKSKSQVSLFQCFLSQSISSLEIKSYTISELDEIVYAILLSGISYDQIIGSDNDVMVRVNTILNNNDYWNMLKKRLLRPKINDNESSNMEQYYEVNIYYFLHRCGFPLSLTNIFSWQPQNSFAKEISNQQFPTLSYLENKHRSLYEISKYSLDYVYYLSLGRPYQAFMAIVHEFTEIRKPYIITQDILKNIVKSIHQIAFSNIYNQQIIGGCFGLLRLIGSTTESLRCYLTLANWLIDWYVMAKEQNYFLMSEGSQLSTGELHKCYEIKIGKLFKLCLSNVTSERKRSRELLLKQLEEIFRYRLKTNYYTQLSEIIDAWSFILYFCQLQGFEFSTLLLEFYAKKNEWLLFLCCAQIFGYSKDQVKLAINKFDDMSIRQHMSYIVSKVEDLSSISTGSFNKTKRNLDFSNKGKNSPIMSANVTELFLLDYETKLGITKSKDHNLNKTKKTNIFSRTILQNAAKDNLIELIFDCRVNSPTKDSTLESMQLNSKKLLAFSLVLNYPFLSVLAFCCENSKPDQKPEECFVNYLNCVSCFILSSLPKRILKEFWNKWEGVAKIEWNEEETIELIVLAIKNRLANIVADVFFVLQPDKYTCISSFYSMISHAVDIWNKVQRDSYLGDFIKKCITLCKNNVLPRDRRGSKSQKDANLLFFNRLLEASLLTAMTSVQKSLGSRFVHEWLDSLSTSFAGMNRIHVKQVLLLDDINIVLLNDMFTVYHDFLDLNKNCETNTKFEENIIPVNIKTKEFMVFVDNLINKILGVASKSVDYTKFRLISDAKKLISRINEAPGFVLLHDKKELWKTTLENLDSKNGHCNVISTTALTDLVSLAFAGQNDKDDIVQLSMLSEQNDCLLDDIFVHSNSVTKAQHGTTNSWRRLVIPEEWQEQILTISDSKQNSKLEVSHVNSLLNEKKWIEACSYMIENDVYVKDAILILISMNIACGKTDPNKLPSIITESYKPKLIDEVRKDGKFKAVVRRLSIFTYSTSKISSISNMDCDSPVNRSNRQANRNSELCLKYLRNVLTVMIHGQEILEYIYTIYCVANKMTESYLLVAREEEFNVLTKILVGTCREKIDTADMYLGVVDIDQDQLSRFIAEITVQVLRSELQSNLASTTVSLPPSSASLSQKDLSLQSGGDMDNIRFTISPTSSNSSRPSSTSQIQRRYNVTYPSSSFSHEYVLKVAQRCQLRPEIHTVPLVRHNSESRLIKAFYLQDFLILTPNHRKLGKILYDFYLHFSQEVFSCKEDAEFLVYMLVQCHNCFTEGGDTVGISHCLKSAKELSRMLTANSYFVLLAQLLCRIGRYGEMPYIFSALIEHDHFELLLRKDMDKEGIIVPYILDYLSRYLSDDFEKIELVCHKYHCNYELAETETKKANSLIKKIRSQSWKNFTKENLKISMSTIISNLLDSCKNYFKVGCYKKVHENLRKAQFYKLQMKWMEDPDKVFATGSLSTPLGKSLKMTSNKVTFPETSLFGGVKLIDMNAEQVVGFLKMIPNFYTAFIIIEQLKLSGDLWIELIVHHVIINADETYMLRYLDYFGRVLSSNFVQQCSNRLDKLSAKLGPKQYSNLKLVLQHCSDIFLVRRLSEKFQLNK